MFSSGNIFNNVGTGIIGSAAASTNQSTANQITPVKELRWFETPIMFILTLTAFLIVLRFAERKLG